MDYGELHLPPVRTYRNPITGRFLKGHEPHNKGKKWTDYMGKRAMKRAMKGWKNVLVHRPKSRPDTAGRSRKETIAVMDDGRWLHFSCLKAAAKWCGGSRENVSRCCRSNQSRKLLRDTKGHLTDRVNTDHRYKGVRFYFENDNTWTEKI